ncbi:uncharacterized protein LOC112502581 isoform X3 [Cynara cardunculus var. scolymus]|uniref:uncharacterized protein LOC112502581 isoform X3 n=1 Tax=Cynara cardunculus var. scolymus TaxID=59895 RepID=UPI000D627890|nr:uncharacterized protein LOC112502581 isoform X3 [Cynara cardunculus var. scolymus]
MRFMRMEKLGVLHLEVGQLAEMRTFVRGFRGAWFRCKIKDVFLEKNKILLEYYDFSDEEISWAKIYEVPHYGRKSKQIKKQLMMRPHYPQMHHTSEMPPVNSISEVCVINDGTWKVGDLVDWFEDSSYWSARVIKVLSDDKVKEGQSSCSAQLIFPSQQDEVNCLDSEREEASSTSRISAAIAIEGGDRERQQEANKMNSEQVKMDGKAVISSSSSSSEDSISTLHVEESKEEEVVVGSAEYSSSIELNMMHEETLEATILDLEELANRIKWIKSILETNQDTSSLSSSSRWKFT